MSFCDFNRSRVLSAFSSCGNSRMLLSLRKAGQLNSLLLAPIRVGTTRLVGLTAGFDLGGVAINPYGCAVDGDDNDVEVKAIRFGFPLGVKLGKSFSCDTFVGEFRSTEVRDFLVFCDCFDATGVRKSPKQMPDAFALRLSFDFSCVDRALVSKVVLLLSKDLESFEERCRELYVELRL